MIKIRAKEGSQAAPPEEPQDPPEPSPDFHWQRPWSWLLVAAGALGSPRVYFRGLADARGLIPPLSFILLTQLIYSLAQWSSAGFQRLGQLPLSLVWGVAQAVFMAVVIHLVASRIMKSPLRLEQALRAFAYSGAVWALAFLAQFLPGAYSAVFLAVMLGLHFYLMMVGLVELGDMSMPLAAACQIIAMVVLFLVMVLINQLGNPAPA